MFQDFKNFISKGSVIDLAIGVIIGGAFTAIVVSLVDDIFMPIIGIFLGGIDISSLSVTVGNATIAYGNFLMALVSFLIIALVLFLIIRFIEAASRKKEEAAEEEPPAGPTSEELLTQIRDLLQEQNQK